MSRDGGSTERKPARGFLAQAVPLGFACLPLLLGALGRDYMGLLWRIADPLSLFRVIFAATAVGFVMAALRSAWRRRRRFDGERQVWGLIAALVFFAFLGAFSGLAHATPMLCYLMVPVSFLSVAAPTRAGWLCL
ncbi:hypothetical protein HQ576_10365 [bacterium]|nr:hypothetical protein [bacterium]